ncbi:hypothetical protein RvY_02687 [Ramazzottius varieornatus]|uniref:G-protein coupled receptors family 1 profile domain-containing protein n=1 Tax=Ramazzottius varieornatus TaxID=947166 RepID=A0A1D1UKL1_RAMVA|nr:hypothetical protein RvY_02687 [Ramazzottius varieornatus]
MLDTAGALNSSAGNTTSTASFSISPIVSTSLLVVIALIWITAFITNLFLCIVFTKNVHLRTNFNLYLFNMTIADLLFVLLSMTNFMLYIFLAYSPLGYHGCTSWLYFDWILSSATENTMMLISLDRVYSIYWPIRYRNLQSTNYSKVAVACMWIWINILILPPLVLSRTDGTVSGGICGIDYERVKSREMIAASVVLAFWLPEAVTVLSYTIIAFKARNIFHLPHENTNAPDVSQNNVLLHDLDRDGSLRLPMVAADEEVSQGKGGLSRVKSSANRQQKERRMFQLSLYLAIAVFLCCGPVDFYYLFAAVKPEWATFPFYLIANLFNFFHCILNPVLYARSVDIRQALRNLFPQRRPDPTKSSL